MRSRILLSLLLALAVAPAAAASAQAPPSLDDLLTEADIPELPAAPKQRGTTFKVSLYGIQRFTQEGTEAAAEGEPACFDSAGSRTSRSVVRFATARPARATLTRLGLGVVGIAFRGDDDPALPVKATFAHSGKLDARYYSCVDGIGWKPQAPPTATNCTATLDHLGFGLSLQRGRLEASGSRSVFVPIEDPFAGCPWGDQSGDLYGAQQRIDTAALLRSEETEVVLRWRDTERSESAAGASTTRRQTTIYVTFKRVR